MARSTYFDRGRIADACPGSESGYAQRFQCGNIVKRLIWTGMRLHHLQYVAKDPMLTRILKVWTLPVQSTYWRFLDSLHGSVAQQLLHVQQKMRERVWAAAQVRLDGITLDTDTTVHTIYSQNKMGARKGYNPKNRGK